MSFIELNAHVGKAYAPGYFLAHEECTRITVEADATNDAVVTAANGGKYLPMGTVYPSNDEEAIGIIYEDVDVSTGNMPASLVTKGVVYVNRLPEELTEDTTEGGTTTAGSKSTLEALGFVFIEEPTVTRPSED